MAKYFITKKAVEDLSSIWDYTFETWSEKQADEYYNSLIREFESIAMRPCYLDREYSEIHPGLFRRFYLKHMIFYRLVEYDCIEIVRILHEKMDIESQLK